MPTFEERRNRAGQVITLRAKIRRRGFPEVSRSFDVNGPSQAVRLLRKVRAAAGAAPEGLVFPMQPDSVSRAFARAVNRARRHLVGDARRASNGHQALADLRFHDLRHEATSRLFDRGLHQIEAAAVTGHKDVRMLMRYTHAQAELLAKKL